MSESSPMPLFVHVHVHKCAGTAFNDLIRRSFAPLHLDAYIANPFPSYTPQELSEKVSSWSRCRSIASHSIRIFPEMIADRPALYVTFLREPVDWFVSYLTYARAHFGELGPEHQGTFPEDATTMPLGDLAAAMIERFHRRPPPYCTFIRYFAESTLRHRLADLMPIPAWDEPLTGLPAQLLMEHGLEMAKRILDRFFFVGIVEQMDLSLQRLRARLEPTGLQLLDEPAPTLNVTRQCRDDLAWASPEHPTGQTLRELLHDDLALYNWARERLMA